MRLRYDKSIMESVFTVECPCCGTTLELDAETRTLLSHKSPKRQTVEDLREAVKKLKAEESSRDEQFRKHVKAEREHEKTRERRFEGLLKKARSEGAPERVLRDIDLD